MTIRVNNLSLDIDEDIEQLRKNVAKKLNISEDSFKNFKIIKESIDARKKDKIKFTYSIEVDLDKETQLVSKINDKDIKIEEINYEEDFKFGNEKLEHRPVVVGMGPAGLFAALLLAQKGYQPIVIERGQNVDERTETVNNFWKSGKLNVESNVQFGEGGAGTFSDGKLTTRIKDSRCDFVLDEFVKSGAPEEIKYMGKPHIGTDILKTVVKNIREEIIRLGGEVKFSSKLEDFNVKNGKLKSIIVNGEEMPCEVLILAIGHSSRDTYEMLFNKQIEMEQKSFAIGVRAEHLQSFISENQYGKFADHPRLKAADYRLTYTESKEGRGVYSFCMCPGGVVVAASSEDKRLVTNGMSYYDRAGVNANSAIVVSVGPKDFMSNSPLAGMEFQRHYEQLAYELGGGDYKAPTQLLGDFMKDRVSHRIGKVTPSYTPGYEMKNLKNCLPEAVTAALKEGFVSFDRKIRGFADKDTVLTGVETRTSAPLRIVRNEKLESISVEGLYPCGEGAGYAGGIVSAAVDGLKCAENLMKQFANN